MPIKTFRGLMADGVQDTIVLHTNDGSMGYRIVKFQLFPSEPGEHYNEGTVKIYKVSPSNIDNTVDFADNTLLAAGYYQDNATYPPASLQVIFDNEIFNQDIYITHVDVSAQSGAQLNYYIELEQVKLDLSENTVATLKDIRNVTTPT